ncbi:hypothetical protein OKA06_17645 [Novosphingobium sp. MW5]|nr:hypothetical protein [Novosphingobium sp. MW5]
MADKYSSFGASWLSAVVIAATLQASPARAETPGPMSRSGSIHAAAGRTPPQPAIRRSDVELFRPVYQPAQYVILASEPELGGVPAAKRRAMEKCLGVAPHYIDSGFFKGLRQGLSLAIFGAFSKEKAAKVQAWARRCVPDAYTRTAVWIGD